VATQATARLELPRGGPPKVLDAGVPVKVTWALRRDDSAQPTLVGPEGGPHLSLPSVKVGVTTAVDSGGVPIASMEIAAAGAELSLSTNLLCVIGR
jgi:hypothetical protein